MNFTRCAMIGIAAGALSLPASAAMARQADAGATAEQPAQPAGQPPAAAATTASTSFTDTEVEQFAKAALDVQTIQADAAVPADQKQAKMAATVEQSGLPPAKFNAIASASQSDPALMQRIQLAANKLQPAAPAQ